MSTSQSTSSPATTSSSSAKRVASTSGSGSGSTSSHNNPFRSGSRDNLPSFAECFSGFHKIAHLGEHNIVAASPQQQWGASAGSRGASSSGSGAHFAMHSSIPSVSANLSPLQLTPRRDRVPGAPSPSQRQHVPLGDAAAPLQQILHHPGQTTINDFSYRTLDVSDEDESASDPLGTPPRQIERDDNNSDDGGVFRSGGSRVGGGGADSGHATPVQRPPLHPAVSPILSSPGRGGEQQPQPFASEAYNSPNTDRRHVGTESTSRPFTGSPQRSNANTAGSAPRRARTLEELAVKHLYPLFGEFLRSLPPKHLEAFVLQADANGLDGDNGAFEDGSWRGGRTSQGSGKRSGAYQPLQDAYALPYVDKYVGPIGSVMERVDMIIPPYHSIIDAPGSSASTLYTRRDFAYHHPMYEDYAGPMSRRFDETTNWRASRQYRR